MKKNIYVFILVVIAMGLSTRTYAYQLLGYKWDSGTYNYYINPTGVDNGTDYSSKSSTIINAAAAWESVSTTNVQINYLGTTSNEDWGVLDYVNVVTWKTSGWSDNVIGLSVQWYSSSGYILDSDIKLNTSFASDSRMSQLVTHEVGHSLGIGHTRESGESYTTNEYNAIMYWLLHSQTELNSEDKCAITAIYPVSSSCTPGYGDGYFECISCCTGESSVVVTISDDTYTYDGTAKGVTVTTIPSGIAYTVTYYDASNNVVASPTDAGTYDVEVDITEAGYESIGSFYGTLTINQKALSVTADDLTIAYGDDKPTYSVSYSGFVSGEDESVLSTKPSAYIDGTSWPLRPGSYTIYCGNGADENYSFSYHTGTLTVTGSTVNAVYVSNYEYTYDGTSKEVTITTDPAGISYSIEYSLNGTVTSSQVNAGDYDVEITITEPGYIADVYGTTMIINKASLTATANNFTVSYGDAEPTYTISYSGFVNSENTSVLNSLPSADVEGSWPQLPGTYTISLSGGSDNNYNFTLKNGTLTVNALSATSVTLSNLQHIYSGTTPAISVTTVPSGLSYSLAYYDTSGLVVASPVNAGDYTAKVTVTQTGYTQSVYRDTLTISKATLTATANNQSVSYGQTEPTYTISYSGFVNSEKDSVIDVRPTADIAGDWPKLPGTYPIVASGGSDNNYTFSYQNGTLTVSSNGSVFITVSDTVQTYSGTAKAVTVSTNPTGIKYSVVYTNSTGSIVASPIETGTYNVLITITESGYSATTKTSSLIIQKAPLTVSTNNVEVNYGATKPSFTVNISGFVNGETSAVLTSSPTATVDGTWPLSPGTYPIVLSGGNSSNYSFSYTNGTLTVLPLVAGSVVVYNTETTYSGLENAVSISTTPTGIDYTINYYKSGNTLTSAPVDAGTYQYKIVITETGYKASEYTGNLVVKKKTLLVSAPTLSVTYGDNAPIIALDYSGFVLNESISEIDSFPTISMQEEWPLDAGEYTITLSGGTDNNYVMEFQNGQLTVEKATLTATANDQTIQYNSSEPTYTYTISGFQNSESSSVIDILPSTTVEGTRPLDAGTYPIVISGASDNNYSFKYINGTLTVEPISQVEIQISDTSAIYNGQYQQVSVTTTPTGINYTLKYEGIETTSAPVNAGSYFVTATIDQTGYLPTQATGVLTIKKATLLAKTADQEVLLGDEEPTYTVEITGYVNGESSSVIDMLPTASVEGVWPLSAGEYTIAVSGGSDNNYDFEYQNGKLTVVQTYLLSVSADEHGSVKNGEEGSAVTSFSIRIKTGENSPSIYAIPESNYKFDQWNDGATDNPRTIQAISSNIELKALFKLNNDIDNLVNQGNTSISVFPNPVEAHQQITINVSMEDNLYGQTSLRVFDIVGKQVYQINKLQAKNQLEGLKQGTYLVGIYMNGKLIGHSKLLVK